VGHKRRSRFYNRRMPKSWKGRLVVGAICTLLSLPLLAKNFMKPVAQPARTYPAHDDHPEDKLAMAADPYDNPEKAKLFSINFAEHGFLPVFFVVTNDGDQPVSMANVEITLITRNHSKLTPLSTEDLYRRMTNPQAQTRPSPIPIPRKSVKGTMSQKEQDEIEMSQFEARAVEPHSTQSGFLFFDVGGISAPLAEANLDITGVADAKGNELLYFEIPMQKYLSATRKR
jgi:hypothetical protein